MGVIYIGALAPPSIFLLLNQFVFCCRHTLVVSTTLHVLRSLATNIPAWTRGSGDHLAASIGTRKSVGKAQTTIIQVDHY